MNIMKKQKKKNRLKKTVSIRKSISKSLTVIGSFLFVIFVINGNAFVVNAGLYDANNVSKEVYAQLEKDGFINVALRGIGKLIHSILATLLDLLEVSFTTLAKYDFLSLEPIAKVNVNLETIILILLFLGFVFIVFVRMFSGGNPLQPVVNAVIMLMCISIFAYSMGVLFDIRVALVEETNGIIGAKENETISETLFRANTYDMVESLAQNKLVTLSEVDGLDLEYLDTEIRIPRAVFNDVIVSVNADGTFETESLQDGWFGVGDVRYFGYRTDYLALNVSELLTVVIFLIGLFKLGFLCGQYFQIYMWGRLALGSMLANVKAVYDVLLEGVGNTLSIWILYFMMSLYGLLSSAILQNDILGNWLGNCILIFAIGMLVLIGDEKILEKLHVNTGGMMMMKSLFAGQRFARMGKVMFNKGADAVGMAKDGVEGAIDAGKGAVDSYKNFSDDMNRWENRYEDMANDRNMQFANSEGGSGSTVPSNESGQVSGTGTGQDSSSGVNPDEESTQNQNIDENEEQKPYGANGIVLTKDGIDYKNAYKNEVWKEQEEQQREQERADKQQRDDDKYKADYERRAIIRDDVNRDVWSRGKDAQANGFSNIKDYESYKHEQESQSKIEESESLMSEEERQMMLDEIEEMKKEMKGK